jgi:hypothetical protein
MSKIQQALEAALELCEGLSMEDLQRYPTASRLIPLLHDLLEQEEECTHVWIDRGNQKGMECQGCGIFKFEAEIVDKGPWRSVTFNNTTIITSDDFKHDVTLKVMGDFATVKQMNEYARMIAKKLNQ